MCVNQSPLRRFRSHCLQVGEGKAAYDAVVQALKSWQHLQLGECEAAAPSPLSLSENQSPGQPVVPSLAPAAAAHHTLASPPAPPPPAGWNCTTAPSQKAGATLCSATQTVVPWSVLPAQVTYCSEGAAQFGPGNKGGLGGSWIAGSWIESSKQRAELHFAFGPPCLPACVHPASPGSVLAGKRFAVGLSSLTGHQLAGEERFQVEMHADGSVW